MTFDNTQAPKKHEKPDNIVTGKIGTEYDYITSTNDPHNDKGYYWCNWGDSSNTS